MVVIATSGSSRAGHKWVDELLSTGRHQPSSMEG
jgi:hypothetical protein